MHSCFKNRVARGAPPGRAGSSKRKVTTQCAWYHGTGSEASVHVLVITDFPGRKKTGTKVSFFELGQLISAPL